MEVATRRLLAMALPLVFAFAGCNKGDALVVVSLSSTTSLSGITQFQCDGIANGHEATFTITPPNASVDLSTTTVDFGVQVPQAYVGAFKLTVTAIGTNNATLATEFNTTTTHAGKETMLAIEFGAPEPGDGGTDEGSCPTSCDDPSVVCDTQITCGDLAFTCPCVITAVDRPVARVGDTITVEGRFAKSPVIMFGGSAKASATLLGNGRASVQIPSGALTGSVSLDGAATGASPKLKIASYTIGLGSFSETYPQAEAARVMPQPAIDRQFHAVVNVGTHVVLIGGVANNSTTGMTLQSFEDAPINADGSLGTFNLWATSGSNARSLVQARAAMVSTVLGQVYVIGGWNNAASGSSANVYTSVEQAEINGDGSGIQTFTTSTVTLNKGRYLAGSKIIGAYLYVFGGFTGGSIFDQSQIPTNTIERAPIGGNGMLGAFEKVSTTLSTARGGFGIEIIGNTLYVLGGFGLTGVLDTIEKAPINGDGTLGAFTDAGITLDDEHAAFGSTVIGNQLYILGGLSSSENNSSAVVVSTIGPGDALGKFVAASSPMVRPRAVFGQPFFAGNELYVVGGGGGSTGTASDIEHASINASGALGGFTQLSATTARARTSPGIAVFGQRVYIFGGQTAAPLTSIESAPINADGSLGAFAPESAVLSIGRSGPGIAVLNNQIFVYGGDPSITTGDAFSINNSTGALSANGAPPPPMIMARQNFQMVATGGYLYAIGGDGTASGTSQTMEYAPLDSNGNPSGTFSPPTAIVNQPHADGMAALIGGSYYLFNNNGQEAAATDASPLGSDSTLGNFATANIGVATAGIWSGALIRVGANFYLLSGETQTAATPAIESLAVGVGNGLEQPAASFVTVQTQMVNTARRAPIGIVLGNYAYLMNGAGVANGSVTDLNSIEQALLK